MYYWPNIWPHSVTLKTYFKWVKKQMIDSTKGLDFRLRNKFAFLQKWTSFVARKRSSLFAPSIWMCKGSSNAFRCCVTVLCHDVMKLRWYSLLCWQYFWQKEDHAYPDQTFLILCQRCSLTSGLLQHVFFGILHFDWAQMWPSSKKRFLSVRFHSLLDTNLASTYAIILRHQPLYTDLKFL